MTKLIDSQGTVLTIKHAFAPERQEWIGIIFQGSFETNLEGVFTEDDSIWDKVLTCGIENSEAALFEWLQAAVDMEPWIEGNDCPEDMYDRGMACRH